MYFCYPQTNNNNERKIKIDLVWMMGEGKKMMRWRHHQLLALITITYLAWNLAHYKSPHSLTGLYIHLTYLPPICPSLSSSLSSMSSIARSTCWRTSSTHSLSSYLHTYTQHTYIHTYIHTEMALMHRLITGLLLLVTVQSFLLPTLQMRSMSVASQRRSSLCMMAGM